MHPNLSKDSNWGSGNGNSIRSSDLIQSNRDNICSSTTSLNCSRHADSNNGHPVYYTNPASPLAHPLTCGTATFGVFQHIASRASELGVSLWCIPKALATLKHCKGETHLQTSCRAQNVLNGTVETPPPKPNLSEDKSV